MYFAHVFMLLMLILVGEGNIFTTYFILFFYGTLSLLLEIIFSHLLYISSSSSRHIRIVWIRAFPCGSPDRAGSCPLGSKPSCHQSCPEEPCSPEIRQRTFETLATHIVMWKNQWLTFDQSFNSLEKLTALTKVSASLYWCLRSNGSPRYASYSSCSIRRQIH